MCARVRVPSVEDMTASAPSVPGATTATLWLLRLVAGVQAVLLVGQPLLAGRFLDGDYPSLARHGNNGLILMGVAWLVVVAAVLAWRPGRLPGWPVPLAVAAAFLMPVQLGMGHARFLAVHLLLGVSLVAAGAVVALWAWSPDRARRSYRPRTATAQGQHAPAQGYGPPQGHQPLQTHARPAQAVPGMLSEPYRQDQVWYTPDGAARLR